MEFFTGTLCLSSVLKVIRPPTNFLFVIPPGHVAAERHCSFWKRSITALSNPQEEREGKKLHFGLWPWHSNTFSVALESTSHKWLLRPKNHWREAKAFNQSVSTFITLRVINQPSFVLKQHWFQVSVSKDDHEKHANAKLPRNRTEFHLKVFPLCESASLEMNQWWDYFFLMSAIKTCLKSYNIPLITDNLKVTSKR